MIKEENSPNAMALRACTQYRWNMRPKIVSFFLEAMIGPAFPKEIQKITSLRCHKSDPGILAHHTISCCLFQRDSPGKNRFFPSYDFLFLAFVV